MEIGNLVNTIDPNANVIAVTYDALGRKTDLNDPDLGHIHYDVDPVGRTWKQTSPNHLLAWAAATPAQRLITDFFTRMEYDTLDRMTGRYEMDLESHWVFDALPAQDCKLTFSCGQLIEAYTGKPASKDYRRLAVYDNKGRNNQTTQFLRDTSYVSTTVFDNWGRPITQSYQRGSDAAKVFDSRYNNKGYLTRIERGSLVLWQVNSQDAAQRVTSARLGNGIVQTRDFNVYNGRVDDGQIVNVNGAVRLSEVYNYDAIGNVLGRNQYWDQSGFSELFEYDDLNRLSKSSVAGQASHNFSFDDVGSILSKTNKGSYHYPAQGSNAIRPHAVTSIDK